MSNAADDGTLFAQVMDHANRADPYPLYRRMRSHPVSVQQDGTCVATTYVAIRQLISDPRVSSEDIPKSRMHWTGHPIHDLVLDPIRNRMLERHRPFIFRDPPAHDILRGMVTSQFTPARIRATGGGIKGLVNELLDRLRDRQQIDLVSDFSYPLPVTVICQLMGVPRADETLFHGWANVLARSLDPDQRQDQAAVAGFIDAYQGMAAYMRELIRSKRAHPTDDLLAGLATYVDPEHGRMNDFDLLAASILLLLAGHETTVNLITNGVLTLLRFPQHMERLRSDPDVAPRLIEELLRFEPPVHYRTRISLDRIEVNGAVIPAGAPMVLLFASGNRDPARFADPDVFNPDREDNQHFGFGGGVHYCVGAPLARAETEAALVALATRLRAPRLLQDPPPYRDGASLRGPLRLDLAIEGISD